MIFYLPFVFAPSEKLNLMVLFHFIWAGLRAKSGRAEVTMEGLAFPNRPSREPLGAEDV